jgi:hypothetical protein
VLPSSVPSADRASTVDQDLAQPVEQAPTLGAPAARDSVPSCSASAGVQTNTARDGNASKRPKHKASAKPKKKAPMAKKGTMPARAQPVVAVPQSAAALGAAAGAAAPI